MESMFCGKKGTFKADFVTLGTNLRLFSFENCRFLQEPWSTPATAIA